MTENKIKRNWRAEIIRRERKCSKIKFRDDESAREKLKFRKITMFVLFSLVNLKIENKLVEKKMIHHVSVFLCVSPSSTTQRASEEGKLSSRLKKSVDSRRVGCFFFLSAEMESLFE